MSRESNEFAGMLSKSVKDYEDLVKLTRQTSILTMGDLRSLREDILDPDVEQNIEQIISRLDDIINKLSYLKGYCG